MGMATTATMERGLLRPLLRPLLMPLLRLLLIPGTDTTALDTEATMATYTGPMAMDTTTERGLLRLSPRPLLMLLLRLLLIPGTDTMAMASTMATMAMLGLMATMAPQTLWLWILRIQALWLLLGKEVKSVTSARLLPTLRQRKPFFYKTFSLKFFEYFVLFDRVPGFIS